MPTSHLLEGHHARNAALLKRAAELGANLQEKRKIDFFFFANDQDSAAALGIGLYEFGMEIAYMAPGKDSPEWSVQARADVSIEQAVFAETTEKLDAIATEAGGVFDGVGFTA